MLRRNRPTSPLAITAVFCRPMSPKSATRAAAASIPKSAERGLRHDEVRDLDFDRTILGFKQSVDASLRLSI
jgi:hypothetical protein